MSTVFDPEAGVLRVTHAALSVLAALAVDPTAPSLTDHATAPALAQLRGAGIVGSAGIHPDVRPLAVVVGAPQARLTLELAERGGAWRAPGWIAPALVVLAVPAMDGEDAFDLVADVPDSAPDLLGDLVGLATGLSDPRTGAPGWDSSSVLAGTQPSSMQAETLEALLDGERTDDGSAADVPPVLARLAGDLRARWRLTVRELAEDRIEVLDAGDSGMWTVRGPDAAGAVDLEPTAPPEVRARMAALLRAALS